MDSAIPEIGGVLSGQIAIKKTVRRLQNQKYKNKLMVANKRGKTLDKESFGKKIGKTF